MINFIFVVLGVVSFLGLVFILVTGGGSLVFLGCVEILGSIVGVINIVINLAKEV